MHICIYVSGGGQHRANNETEKQGHRGAGWQGSCYLYGDTNRCHTGENFEQRPKESVEETCHVMIWGKTIPERRKNKPESLRQELT